MWKSFKLKQINLNGLFCRCQRRPCLKRKRTRKLKFSQYQFSRCHIVAHLILTHANFSWWRLGFNIQWPPILIYSTAAILTDSDWRVKHFCICKLITLCVCTIDFYSWICESYNLNATDGYKSLPKKSANGFSVPVALPFYKLISRYLTFLQFSSIFQ